MAADEGIEVNNPSFIGPGSIEVSGTFEATFAGDAQQLAGLFPPGPPKHDVRLDYADGAGRRCPVCEEPAVALVIEAVSLMFTPGARIAGSGERRFQLAGSNPAAYRCEPCGHRFDRDGQEIG